MPAPKGPVMLRIGPVGPIVSPWSNMDTRPCQARPRRSALFSCGSAVQGSIGGSQFPPTRLEGSGGGVPERAEEVEPNQPKFGWQQCASRSLETKFLNERVWPRMTEAERALLRSQQRVPLASAGVTALPTTRATRMDGQPFRILLLRRLWLPLPLSSRTCRCGRQLDSLGHHRAACSEAGVLGWRGFPLEVADRCAEKQEHVSPRTFSCGTWTWRRLMSWTADALKSWQMA